MAKIVLVVLMALLVDLGAPLPDGASPRQSNKSDQTAKTSAPILIDCRQAPKAHGLGPHFVRYGIMPEPSDAIVSSGFKPPGTVYEGPMVLEALRKLDKKSAAGIRWVDKVKPQLEAAEKSSRKVIVIVGNSDIAALHLPTHQSQSTPSK